jgi:hypothetical protein
MIDDARRNNIKEPPIYMRMSDRERLESNTNSASFREDEGESYTDNNGRTEREKQILRSACHETLRQMLGQPLKYTRMNLYSAYDRRAVNSTMTNIGALYFSFCELSLGEFCKNNDLEDVYEESINDILLSYFKRKQLSEIHDKFSRKDFSNIKSLSDNLTEKKVRSHIWPYHDSMCYSLGEENPESKKRLFDWLVNTMTNSLQSSAAFVLLVRKPEMSGTDQKSVSIV